MKRGEKLNLETARTEADLVDNGLRYDLTVPLCRYYANHANDLPILLRRCRWEMYGVRTDLREAGTVSLCSAILTLSENPPIWLKSS